MSSPERIYHGSIRAFSFVFIVLGLVILVTTLAAGGGPLSIGTLRSASRRRSPGRERPSPSR